MSLPSVLSSASSAFSGSAVVRPPPAVAVPPLRGGNFRGRQKGSGNWTPQMTDVLLDQVKAVLPRGHYEWEKVVGNYNTLTGESADYDRLHDKFFKLVRTVKPTGKNTKPTHVTRAQEISAEIDGSVYGGLGDEEEKEDNIDRAMQALLSEEEEQKDVAASDPPSPRRASSPSSSSSSPSPVPSLSSSSPVSGPRSPLNAFPSERATVKKSKSGSDMAEAVQALSTTFNTAIAAQMEASREEAKLAREQAREEAKLAREQMAQNQKQWAEMLIMINNSNKK
jgi:hypothetical protein